MMPKPAFRSKDRRTLNIAAIEAALRSVQHDFGQINAVLSSPRDPMTDEVVANMLAGYRSVDYYLADGVDLFKPGNSRLLLDLNRVVLCGEQSGSADCNQGHLEVTERRFYETPGGGVRDLVDWMKLHRGEAAWKRAAGVFTRILSQPQLFIEGNHRTGALLMSYLLGWEGKPPFVLTVQNAKHFFNPAALIKQSRKQGVDNLLRLPKLTKRFARLLEDQADDTYLAVDRSDRHREPV